MTGYHQLPLMEEHRNLTCMATPRGTMGWRVLVMGLKNGNAIFQRVMESVLQDLSFADPYVDDVIVGSTGANDLELISNHLQDLKKVLDALQASGLVADPGKASSLSGKWSSVATSSGMARDSRHQGNCSLSRNGSSLRR